MRDYLVKIWRFIMRVKFLYPIILFGKWFMETRLFNCIIDYTEKKMNYEKYESRKRYFISKKAEIEKNISYLSDERSKIVYRNIINYRCTLNRKCLKGVTDKRSNQYFDKIVKFKPNELFIDCGAYIGDTLKSLEKHFDKWDLGKITAISFEPDKFNIQQCKKEISKIQKRHKNFKGYCIQKGVWNELATLSFNEGQEYASKLEPGTSSECTVDVTAIDEIVRKYKTKNNEMVTFIKMDVEGSEPEALEGAINCILSDHPKLAISIYHTDEQMINIIEWIHQNAPFYSLYIRHYTYAWTDTILYAIDQN